ncbi:MAG: DEAD/DEAH box helicase family protein [Elusimicrobiaceae bacterium]|nr:DEAD/DEAH box helicase family protein [Elusimicrobiaceae bacterium]
MLKFNGTWRNYQQRILDSLELHLVDNKIHVVAAPGAGKTTLGLEVIARLNRPTLILAPTITIRAQWKQRLAASFLNGQSPDIISTDIRHPGLITITTYQALLAAFCGKEEPTETEENEEELLEEETEENEKNLTRLKKEKADEVIAILKQAHIDLLCFDEAHHLRNEWWKALVYLLDNLKPKQTISLTATPPYDADTAEWDRYSSLCGSIDEVISIPELVQNGDLCPHQDFIHFSLLRKTESEQINKTLERIAQFIEALADNEILLQAVTDTLLHESEEVMLDNPPTYVALASFLKWADAPVPERFLDLFGFSSFYVPSFNSKYQKLFLSFVLFKHPTGFAASYPELIEKLRGQAKAAGIISSKSIYINDGPKIKRQIANSLGKLDSIQDIVTLETECLGKQLRLVILADYIKYDITDCSALGVIPIWQTLKERKNISLGVLTGTIILLPQPVVAVFKERLQQAQLHEQVTATAFDRDPYFFKITVPGSKKAGVVRLITQLFNEGYLTVLVGTQALLGEGWDAPSINSLILSSTVSSYMLSNQMRGRAIRKDKNNPNKVANIWHLASVKIPSLLERLKQHAPTASKTEFESAFEFFDLAQLEQRFKGYEAPGIYEPYYIENGLDRILPKTVMTLIMTRGPQESDFIGMNSGMKARARDRALTRKLWEKGLHLAYSNPEKALRKGIQTEAKMKDFYYSGGYFSILTFWAFLLGTPGWLCAHNMAYKPAIFFFTLFVLVMLKPTYKFLKCSSPEKIMRQMGIVVLETLSYMGLIKTSLQQVNIKCKNIPGGGIFFSVTNVSPEENNLIIKCMQEIVDPIENPRYIFIRKSKLDFLSTTDYHSIPTIIGQKQANVQVFEGLWNKYIGGCHAVYTRTREGRKLLLKARKAAFSSLVRTKKSKKLSRYE